MYFITSTILADGYAIVELEDEAYMACGERLGSIVSTDLVKIQPHPKQSTSLSRSGAIPLHTDHPLIDIVAWRCEIADPAGVGILLLDLKDLTRSFPVEVLRGMSYVKLRHPQLRLSETEGEWSLVTLTEQRTQIYFAPWLWSQNQDDEQRQLAGLFQEYVRHRTEAQVWEVAMRKGVCLFVDNHRVLHGRRELHPNSPRKLKRLWIQSARSKPST